VYAELKDCKGSVILGQAIDGIINIAVTNPNRLATAQQNH